MVIPNQEDLYGFPFPFPKSHPLTVQNLSAPARNSASKAPRLVRALKSGARHGQAPGSPGFQLEVSKKNMV